MPKGGSNHSAFLQRGLIQDKTNHENYVQSHNALQCFCHTLLYTCLDWYVQHTAQIRSFPEMRVQTERVIQVLPPTVSEIYERAPFVLELVPVSEKHE